ncbi:MAG: non-homologous end-joining DNA ligase [Bacillota bacterium]
MLLGKPFRPMEPVRYAEPFDSPEWGFQVKWDGVRILVHKLGQKVVLYNKKLHERTNQYPDLIEECLAVLGCQEAVLDGEVVVLAEGRPHFARVLQRDWATNPRTIRSLVQQLPIAYMVFDLLHLDGVDLTNLSFCQRQEYLQQLVAPGSIIYPVETVLGTGRSIFTAVVNRNLEGIVAKRLTSTYLLGQKSDLWRKIKNVKQQSFIVGGYLIKEGRPNSLLLGAYVENDLIYVGRVSSGLSAAHLNLIRDHFPPDPSVPSPFRDIPRLPPGETEVQWLPPCLVAVVEFLEWTDDLKVRHPKIIGFSTDSPESCTL